MIIVAFILFFAYAAEKLCKLDFLSQNGLDGEQSPQVRRMLLCPSIKFSCCNVFDELKFHKKWYDYYAPKLELTHNKAIAYYKQLIEPIAFFTEFDWTDKEVLVSAEKLVRTKDILFKLKKIQLDGQLRPLFNDLPKILEFETKIKKGFVCLLCDFVNHEYLSASNIYMMVQENFCQRLMGVYGPFLQKRAKLLNPLLMLAYKAMGNFKTPFYQKKNVETIKHVVKHNKSVVKCFLKENADYDLENCKGLCNKYSASSLSPAFYGEFGFYIRFLDRYKKFIQWIDSVKEAEKAPPPATEAEKPVDGAPKSDKPAGRILESRDHRLKRNINKISRSLGKYKKIIKNLRRNNKKYLKRINHNNRELKRKRNLITKSYEKFDYGVFYNSKNHNSGNQGYKAGAVDVLSPRIAAVVAQPVLPVAPVVPVIPVAPVAPGKGKKKSDILDKARLITKCDNTTDSFRCSNSFLVTNSSDVSKSRNITDSKNVTKSQNITKSFNILSSTNCTESFNITDGVNVTSSVNVTNATDVRLCSNCNQVFNSTNCTNCRNCTNVVNCTNCENAYNVTNGYNIVNITSAVNVSSVINGTMLENVSNSLNVTMLANCANMTNATNSSYCYNNYNCTQKHCTVPRIDNSALKQKIKEIIYQHSEKIIDRIYSLFKTGSLEGYKADTSAFDPQIYRASSLYNDLDRFRYLFDEEGVNLENDIGPSFEPSPEKVKLAALKELLIEKNSKDIVIVKAKKSDELRTKLTGMVNFDLVYGFMTDVNRGIMSYDYIRSRKDEELKIEDDEDANIEITIVGDKDADMESAPAQARRLINLIKPSGKTKKQ